ncbi:MAG: carbon-nitrogen hydrolase family protein [Candidatus Methylomirabilia bacterium]
MVRYVEFTLAAIQAAPVFFDREASTEKACQLIEEAARHGATLAAFGETWLPGYPFFAFSPPGPLWWRAAAEYLATAVEIPSPTTDRLCAAARRAGIDVVIGVVELDPRTRGTVYCTLLFISREGAILGRHRKLKPTHAERAIWGEGDALGLKIYERPYGRISGLCCWEHNMVLPGYALMAQGTQIHVAAWPGREPSQAPAAPVSLWPRQLLLSRTFASQAACYVVLAAGVRLPDDTPERYRELATFYHTGDSYIIDPRGEIMAGPAQGETILTARGSLEAVLAAKAGCDVGGHYSRPDIFQLHVSGRPLERVVGLGPQDSGAPSATGSLIVASDGRPVVPEVEPAQGGQGTSGS